MKKIIAFAAALSLAAPPATAQQWYDGLDRATLMSAYYNAGRTVGFVQAACILFKFKKISWSATDRVIKSVLENKKLGDLDKSLAIHYLLDHPNPESKKLNPRCLAKVRSYEE